MREGDDAIRDVFCGSAAPSIRSLRELQEQLEAASSTYESERGSSVQTGIGRLTATVVLGHSTALSGQLVSAINPRLIILRNELTLAFQRGIQRIELIGLDRASGRLNFYLLDFEQACNARAGGCSPGDLFTPAIESDWTRVSLRDDEDLKNTPSDCRQCHQRGTDTPMLLMRELQSPWTHFFYPLGSDGDMPIVTGADLLQDYVDAKGDEPYGGFAIDQLAPSAPFALEGTIDPAQPLVFDSPQIEAERWPLDANGSYATEPQPSPTWERGYAAFKRGEQLALPYVDARVTDPAKLRAVTDAYRRYRAGELGVQELPDLADVFPDDPAVRARIGLQSEPGSSPQAALIQACASCHNDVLDQTISRARFSVSVSRLDRGALDRAIDRLQLPSDAPGVMPPPEARQLDDETREKLIAYLRGAPADLDPDGHLEQVARGGMMGGGRH